MADPRAAALTRRRLIGRAGAGVAGLGALGWLNACSRDEEIVNRPRKAIIPRGRPARDLRFSSWPLYIDYDSQTRRSATFEGFRRRYGTSVDYRVEIQSNDQFFTKLRPLLARGRSGGRDLWVVTDWMASRMKRLGYAQRLDHSVLPNVRRNLLPRFAHAPYDRNREYSVPWLAGMTGLVYRRDKLGLDPTSINDIFDARYRGRVTMLREMRDTVGMTMLGLGFDPERGNLEEALQAIAKIDKARRDGQIASFAGADYTRGLLTGDTWLAFGWSGDAAQLRRQNPNIAFSHPEQGVMLWTDNMQVPPGAPHAYTAELFMDYVYEPEVQARIAAAVQFVTPVAGVREVLRTTRPDLVDDPLIFPTAQQLASARFFRALSPRQEQTLETAYRRVLQI